MEEERPAPPRSRGESRRRSTQDAGDQDEAAANPAAAGRPALPRSREGSRRTSMEGATDEGEAGASPEAAVRRQSSSELIKARTIKVPDGPFPESWLRPGAVGKGGKDNLKIRRMVDDLIRQGKTNEKVAEFLQTEYPEYILAEGISDKQINLVRERQAIELSGVPVKSRSMYREAVVKCMGGLIVPWDEKSGTYANNRLEIDKLGITQIPEELFSEDYAHNIRVLSLTENLITTIPPEISRLTDMTQMRLFGNKLSSIPAEIGKLKGLKILWLGNNKLQSVPLELGKLTGLEALSLDQNLLELLPITLGRLTNVKDLRLDNNPKLRSPPPHVVQNGTRAMLQYLRTLDAGDVSGRVNLSNYQLTEFPVELLEPRVFNCLRVHQTTITELKLDSNQITAIPDDFIVLGQKQPVGKRLSQLANLSLSNNLLQGIPYFVVSLSQLQALNLEKNIFLTALPVELGRLSNLTELRLTLQTSKGENQFTSPPQEILELSMERAVLDPTGANILKEGSARVLTQYLRMIDDAKKSRRLYHMNMGLKEFAPELHIAAVLSTASDATLEDRIAEENMRDKMQRMYLEPIGRLLDLTFLYVSRNQLKKLPASVGNLTHLVHLSAEHNLLEKLPRSIGNLHKLREISAGHNKIDKLPNSIGECSSLVRLTLHHNAIRQLPKDIGKCTKLQLLRMSENHLVELPSEIGELRALTVAELSSNRIDKLPNSISKLTRLELLHLEQNMLLALPEEIGNCVAIGSLCLQNNRLTQLPLSLGSITRLSILHLDDNEDLSFPPPQVISRGIQMVRSFLNKFRSSGRTKALALPGMRLPHLPDPALDYPSLTSIDVSFNDIGDLPKQVDLFQDLLELRLQHNRLRSLPDSIGNLPSLRLIHASHNFLSTLPPTIVKLTDLTDLSIECNNLKMLPLAIGGLLNLTVFGISGNPLLEPPDDVINSIDSDRLSYNYLRRIYDSLSSNELVLQDIGLRAIPIPILDIVTLESVLLDRNKIASIPEEFGALANLKRLSMEDNRLQNLHPCFEELQKLETLVLSGNLLKTFDSVIVELRSLKELRLDNNAIISLPERIDKLSNLTSLIVTNTPIIQVPQSLCRVTSLTELAFDSTKIRRLPMTLGYLTSLQSMELDFEEMEQPRPEICCAGFEELMAYMGRYLEAYETSSFQTIGKGLLEIPTEFFSFKHINNKKILSDVLTSLNLSKNHLSRLPKEFVRLSRMTELDLSYNNLNRVQGEICWLTGLVKLELKGNYHLRRLPIEMGDMGELTDLGLSVALFQAPPQEILMKADPNDHAYCKIGVIEYLRYLLEARRTRKLRLTRMGLRQFPPEVITAFSLYWEFGEVKATFVEGHGSLDVLQEIHLDFNNIQLLPACIGQLTKVQLINLSSNLIQVLPASIANMTSLHTLNLSKNKLSIINPIISKMTCMTKLQLQENRLTAVPELISCLVNLSEISLSKNFLTELPHSLPTMTNLKNILVAKNRLKTDPSGWGLPGVSHELGYMPNLIELNLEQNEHLEVPPQDLRQGTSENILKFLRLVYEARTTHSLALHDMDLREVPKVILLMQYLHTLSLSSNTLRSVTADIQQMTGLTYLDFDKNDLVMLPEEATKLSNLVELHCCYNQLRRLPETCGRWIRVERIIATDNHIQHIPDSVCEMPNLTELDLERNKLRTLPESFIICTNLTRLRFDTADMVKASPAKDLPDGIRRCEIPAEIAIRGVDEVINHFFKMHQAWSTRELDLSGFGLRYVMDDVCMLSVLTKLDLSDNRVKILPSLMTNLKDLKEIKLNNCFQLQHFDHDMCVLTNLSKISIKAGLLDSWTHPIIQMKYPPTIVSRSPDLMRMYLAELSDCVGRHYFENGNPMWETTMKLDYRFVPHDVALDPVTAAEIDSDAKRSFPDFPPEIFSLKPPLTNLTTLHLPGGRITSEIMADRVAKLTRLKKLVLIDQEIDYIPPETGLLTDLEVLCLTGNRISEIPSFIFKMISLTKLVFVENKIGKIPPEIGKLTNLTDLVLTYNRLTALPKEIGLLEKLDYLVLDENQIRAIPDSLDHLTNLIEFSFNDNRITRFPLSMGAITQLEILEFAKNPPISLPPKQVLECEVSVIVDFMRRLWDCIGNSRLNFRNFQLTVATLKEIIKEVAHCCTDLDVSKNKLDALPASLKTVTGLTKLNVSENQLNGLNLEMDFEVQERPKTKELPATNLTLRKFFENIHMMHVYHVVADEYGVHKMDDLVAFAHDDEKVGALGLGDLERMRFLDAVHQVEGDKEQHKDEFEPESQSEAASEKSEDDPDFEEKDGDDEEEGIDEEEAQRLLDDSKGDGPKLKFDLDTFKNAAYEAKVAFYRSIVAVKAKMVERVRRKEQRALDKRVENRASGFQRKVQRLENSGLKVKPKKKKVTRAQKELEEERKATRLTEEEIAEKKAQHLAKKEQTDKAREEALGGHPEDVDLHVSAGGGIVQENIYSVSLFTSLTDLRARKNNIEYLPEDLGDLEKLVHLDFSANDVRWIPASCTRMVSLQILDARHNEMYELPSTFGRLTSLHHLRLDHNKLYTLPESMANMTELRRITLDHNNFQLLPQWLDKLKGVQIFNFNHNAVKRFPGTFASFAESLTELRFAYNKFGNVSTMFTRMSNLKILDMSGNPVIHLHESLGGCTSLVELYANFCSLDTMDIHLAKCRQLEKFEYDGNSMLTYPPREVSLKGPSSVLRYFRQILDCPRTKMMILDGFDLAEVDRIILRYPELTWLDMSNNNIGEVPADLRQLQVVEHVNFSSNKLGSIPKILSLMHSINDLSLDRNGIEVIEPSVMLLTNLTRLSLAENEIARIHPALFKLTTLNFLNLNDNRIQKLPGMIDSLDGLVSLGLGSNVLEEIPNNIRYLTNLKQLVLFGNKISKLPEAMKYLQNLEILTVSQNNLKTFPGILAVALTNLQELWLTHNKLESLPPEMMSLKSLRQLWLQDNKLQALPLELGHLTGLKVLTLTGNKLKEIPRYIKELKIVQHADREDGEEYWQDKEQDGFSMGEDMDSEMLSQAETMPWTRTAEDDEDARILSITQRKTKRKKPKDVSERETNGADDARDAAKATDRVVPKLSFA